MGAFFKKFILILFVGFLCLLLTDFGNYSFIVNGSNFIDLIYFFIFTFIVFFFWTSKDWNETTRKKIRTCIIIYCCFNVFTVVSGFGIICIKKDREGARMRACWENIKLISSAVEMYNMDNSVMMENLDLQKLNNSAYIHKELSFPYKDCYYTNIDNLTDDGFVCCAEHFSPNSKLSYRGYCIEYDLNEDTFKKYKDNDFDLSFEDYKKLKDKFLKLKTNINRGMIDEQRKDICMLNATIKGTTPYIEQARFYLKENKEAIKVILLPLLLLFFPYFLHPMR